MAERVLRLGTRGSKLARWQADWTAARLTELGHQVQIVEITTTGDANQTADLGAIGGIGLFTKEIQRALLDETVDVAVHSLKDLPTTPVPELTLAAVPEREVVADALVSNIASSIDGLPQGARVGTGSLRRRSQLLKLRPDLALLDLRGNVDTRLRKLDSGEYDAIILAAAGLTRLGLDKRIAQQIPFEQMLPAPGQGALGIECRAADEETLAALAPLNNGAARATVTAERTMLAHVEGGCLAAIGAHASVAGAELHLAARILSPDGTECLAAESTSTLDDAEAVGRQVGDELLAQGARRLVEERR